MFLTRYHLFSSFVFCQSDEFKSNTHSLFCFDVVSKNSGEKYLALKMLNAPPASL